MLKGSEFAMVDFVHAARIFYNSGRTRRVGEDHPDQAVGVVADESRPRGDHHPSAGRNGDGRPDSSSNSGCTIGTTGSHDRDGADVCRPGAGDCGSD